ncbi:hypothetical protein DL765_002042 [Monosporascus sp. GIB2]|nr:hypothetical protein DL765_002042 [Monosporascus sp. GIB2]
MHTSRFQVIRSRFSSNGGRTPFRRSSSASSQSTSLRGSFSSTSSSAHTPVDTINAVLFRQPSIVDFEEEKRNLRSELSVLEPRPIVYWGGVEERMGSF